MHEMRAAGARFRVLECVGFEGFRLEDLWLWRL